MLGLPETEPAFVADCDFCRYVVADVRFSSNINALSGIFTLATGIGRLAVIAVT